MTILKKITDRIRFDYKKIFSDFNAEHYSPVRPYPEPVCVPEIARERFFLIAEAKKGSPSKGIIREDFDPVSLAVDYQKAGAAAVSVITEENFFYGSLNHLVQVRENVDIPILRKDFIIHPYQIYQAYEAGADMVLLITACLCDEELEKFYRLIKKLKMTPLVEVHDEHELERALKVSPEIVGVNNRDLKTFKVDLNISFSLRRMIPDEVLTISESGIANKDQITELKKSGFHGALVGESILSRKDVFSAVKELLNG